MVYQRVNCISVIIIAENFRNFIEFITTKLVRIIVFKFISFIITFTAAIIDLLIIILIIVIRFLFVFKEFVAIELVIIIEFTFQLIFGIL